MNPPCETSAVALAGSVRGRCCISTRHAMADVKQCRHRADTAAIDGGCKLRDAGATPCPWSLDMARPRQPELGHPALERGRLQAKPFGRAAPSANAPMRAFERFADVLG